MVKKPNTIAQKIGGPDAILLAICLLLIFSGFLILASVSASFSLQKTGSTFFYLNHQLLVGLFGFFAAFALYLLPIGLIKKWSFAALAGTVLLLLAVFLPGVGGEIGGAQRWLFLGPVSFQPSELLKLSFVLYLATFLGARAKASLSKKESISLLVLPFLAVCGLIGIILLRQPDMSTLGVISLTGLSMYFLAGTPLFHTVAFLAAGGGAALLFALSSPYRLSRIKVLFDPSLDPLGQGWQIKQALIGIGSGGLTGLGLSFQKFGMLPEPMSDSVFAVFAEEMGFLGAVFLIALFLAFAWRGFTISRRAVDAFSQLAAAGITLWITLQAFIHMGALTGILPLTGIPLPFISYGGSSLVVELMALGILLNISRRQTKGKTL
ncbi:MAG: putative lipid II flippase FtsW [Candidatus Yanofskybacteria bacterium]|nr:putative lipid II flippase FtsW [Candidatus Yanofskybacteria bacterium]